MCSVRGRLGHEGHNTKDADDEGTDIKLHVVPFSVITVQAR